MAAAAASFSKNYGRRLSELLQEQQEPFLLDAAAIARRPHCAPAACCPVAAAAACRRLLRLCGRGFKTGRGRGGGGAAATSCDGLRCALSRVLCGNTVRWVLCWELECCFSGGGRGRMFRRLPRPGDSGNCDVVMDFDDDDDDVTRWRAATGGDSSRQLSPVSVLELCSNEESPVHCHWEDEKPSTSGSSPSPASEAFLGPTSPCFTFNSDKSCAMEWEEKFANGNPMAGQVTSWEKVAGDISKIPTLVELELSHSMQEWRWFRAQVMEIGTWIETLVFEEISREAVCDMLANAPHCTLETSSC